MSLSPPGVDQSVPETRGYSRETTEEGPEWTNNLFKHVVKGGPAGGGFSTVEDLFRFATALRSHKLLSREYTELVLSAKPEANSPDYGYGFTVRGAAGNRVVGHGGGFPGINSNLEVYLDTGYTTVVMSNYDNGARIVNGKLRELLQRGQDSGK